MHVTIFNKKYNGKLEHRPSNLIKTLIQEVLGVAVKVKNPLGVPGYITRGTIGADKTLIWEPLV